MLAVLLIRLGAGPVPAKEAPAPSVELKFVVILSRHGVRSPTWSTEQLNQYSTVPWPQWHVPPGQLTPHGKTLMQLLGAYDRAYLAQAGLLSPTGCADAGHVYFRADPEERTLEIGRALAVGMLSNTEDRTGVTESVAVSRSPLRALSGCAVPQRATPTEAK